MEMVLEGWPSRILAAAVAMAATAALSLEIWKHLEAGRLAQEGTLASLEQAERFEPNNAELYWRQGRQEMYSESGSPQDAIAALDKATQLDPKAGVYWTDLAQAREGAGDAKGAAEDLARARAAEPKTPLILWQAMSFALRNNQPEQALGLGRELLAVAPPYTSRALPQLAQVADLDTLIKSVLPANQGAINAMVVYLCDSGELKPTAALWDRVMATGLPPTGFYLRYLLDSLIGQGDGEMAARVWRDSARNGWIGGNPAEMEESFYNSDFRWPMLGFGFDWRVYPHEEASVWVSDEGPEPGEACMCADFSDRARADFANIVHPVVVEPGQHYLLSAKLRVRHVATRTGAFLTVSGLGVTGQQQARTDAV